MRVVKEIPHSACKITVFSWNQKYLIKLEQGDFEQTFKVSEFDVLESLTISLKTVDKLMHSRYHFD